MEILIDCLQKIVKNRSIFYIRDILQPYIVENSEYPLLSIWKNEEKLFPQEFLYAIGRDIPEEILLTPQYFPPETIHNYYYNINQPLQIYNIREIDQIIKNVGKYYYKNNEKWENLFYFLKEICSGVEINQFILKSPYLTNLRQRLQSRENRRLSQAETIINNDS